MWGNPTRERERERYYSASGKYNTTTNTHFQPRENTSQPQTIPHNLPWKTCQNLYSCTNSSFMCLEKCAQLCVVQPTQYGPVAARKTKKSTSIFVPKGASKTVSFFLMYGLYGSVHYDHTPKMEQHSHIKTSWDLCPPSPWEMCHPRCSLFSLKHTQKISLNLLPICLAHYPMHSFINLKMTFSLQSVFSPSPTLNPKAKIRSCPFQDQGS
jgi:hypothetical protein